MKKSNVKKFCEYLVSGGVFQPVLLTNPQAMKQVENIITHADDEELKHSTNFTIQTILSEYDEWRELNPAEQA